MLKDHQTSGSEEDFLKIFTIYSQTCINSHLLAINN